MSRINEQLDEFITRARRAGRGTDVIRSLLVGAGWKPEQVEPYLADDELVPPPPPAARASGRDVFFYLISFFTLAICATSLGGIAFGVINRFLPDATLASAFRPSQLHWSLAWFIVGAPVFILAMRKLLHEAPPAAAAPAIRRVLTYLALFLASATIIGDVAALVYQFVAGTVTVRFTLKVLVILLLGGWVLLYYWVNVRTGERSSDLPRGWHRYHAAAFLVTAALALIVGFALAGSPAEQRVEVRDQQRVMDLQAMYSSIQSYYEFEKKLPSAAELSELYQGALPADPATSEPYEYTVADSTKFSLCATFEAASADEMYSPRVPQPLYEPYGASWQHKLGRHCFDLQVRPITKQ